MLCYSVIDNGGVSGIPYYAKCVAIGYDAIAYWVLLSIAVWTMMVNRLCQCGNKRMIVYNRVDNRRLLSAINYADIAYCHLSVTDSIDNGLSFIHMEVVKCHPIVTIWNLITYVFGLWAVSIHEICE